jgi:hypothetical protein
MILIDCVFSKADFFGIFHMEIPLSFYFQKGKLFICSIFLSFLFRRTVGILLCSTACRSSVIQIDNRTEQLEENKSEH